jgi:hypothetical protein
MLNIGCFPHGHLLSTTFIISDVLHSLQYIPIVSPGTLKDGRVPHEHFFITTLIISDVLQFKHRTGLPPGALKLEYLPHGHLRGIYV